MSAVAVPEITFIAVGRVAGQTLASYCHDPGEGKNDQFVDIFQKVLDAAAKKLKRGARHRLQWGECSICCLVDQQGELLYCAFTTSLAYPERLAYNLLFDVMATVLSAGSAEVGIDTTALRRKMEELACKYGDPQNPDLQHEAVKKEVVSGIGAADRDYGVREQRRSAFGLPQVMGRRPLFIAGGAGVLWLAYKACRGQERSGDNVVGHMLGGQRILFIAGGAGFFWLAYKACRGQKRSGEVTIQVVAAAEAGEFTWSRTQEHSSASDFEELRALGEGAFGTVSLVRHTSNGKTFAMKKLDKAKYEKQKITQKALSEQSNLAAMDHPHILRLQYSFQDAVSYILVTEYAANGHLQDLLQAKGAPGLPVSDVARLGDEVLLALGYVHGLRIIHRGVKLEDMLLNSSNSVILSDFGLSKMVPDGIARTMCGNYGYAAPEIMLNKAAYSFDVDLYSHGVALYMLLSGGDCSPSRRPQRLPPMKHSSLRRKINAAKLQAPGPWAQAEVGAVALLDELTSDAPETRGTATSVRSHAFFRSHCTPLF